MKKKIKRRITLINDYLSFEFILEEFRDALMEYVKKTYSNKYNSSDYDKIIIDLNVHEDVHEECGEIKVDIYGERIETDEEYNQRIQYEKKRKDRELERKSRMKNSELLQLKRLAKKHKIKLPDNI